MKFNIGDQVADKLDKDIYYIDEYSYDTYTIVSTTSDNRYVVARKYNSTDEYTRVVAEEDIISLEDAKQKIEQYQYKRTALESEFEKVRPQIREKMKQCDSLLTEAVMLASLSSKTLRDLDEFLPVLEIIKADGWNSSTLEC